MSTSLQKGLLIKIFVGCQLTSELRMHLNESNLWKQAAIAPQEERDLIETHFQQHGYLGRFLEEQELSLEQLRAIKESVRKSITALCPKFCTERLEFCLFSQVFVS